MHPSVLYKCEEWNLKYFPPNDKKGEIIGEQSLFVGAPLGEKAWL